MTHHSSECIKRRSLVRLTQNQRENEHQNYHLTYGIVDIVHSTLLSRYYTINMTKLLVIVGTGPGIGLSTATLFASKGFNVALLSRNPDRLEEDVKKVGAAGKGRVKVVSFPVDVSDHVALKKTLGEVEQHMGKPEVVVFNAARIAKTIIGETSEQDIIEDFKVSERLFSELD